MRYFILVLIIFLTSCGVTKDKTNKEIENKTIAEEKKNVKEFDFSTTDTKDYSLDYEPIDPTKEMTIDTSEKGVLKTSNAKLKKRNTNTKTNTNKQTETNTDASNWTNETTTEQTKVKEEVFNPQYLIYAVAFLGVVVVIGFFAFGYMIMKIQKSMPTAIINAIKEIV